MLIINDFKIYEKDTFLTSSILFDSERNININKPKKIDSSPFTRYTILLIRLDKIVDSKIPRRNVSILAILSPLGIILFFSSSKLFCFNIEISQETGNLEIIELLNATPVIEIRNIDKLLEKPNNIYPTPANKLPNPSISFGLNLSDRKPNGIPVNSKIVDHNVKTLPIS